MAGLIPTFAADYPGAIVVPAHETNVLRPANHPKVLVLHTPEEAADDVEVTPGYFQTPNLRASTHFYGDSDGDIYQMVPVRRGAIANGVTAGMPYPDGTDSSISLNYQSESIELEGYAASIADTMRRGGPQWTSCVEWIRHRAKANGIPIVRSRIIGHKQVSNERSDPGHLDIDALVEDALNEEDDDMPWKIIRAKNKTTAYALVGGGNWKLPNRDVLKDLREHGLAEPRSKLIQLDPATVAAIPSVPSPQ